MDRLLFSLLFIAAHLPPFISARRHCNGTEEVDKSMFPPDLFTDDQLAAGFVVLPCLGILYMFVALALICDDYFVPSLDVLTETLALAPDVAGATFMAAGGSAPELFTSIIGVFLTKSDVGIGTIVGSAVFNVLFVIAACAFASATALKLTPWPLMRDTFFYSIALGLLAYFFTDNEIKWWESLILFLWYLAYVSFMKFNGAAEDKVSGWLGGSGDAALPGGIKGLRGARGRGLLAQMSDQMQATTLPTHEQRGGLKGLHQILGGDLEMKEREVEEEKVEVAAEEKEEAEWENPVTSGLSGGLASKIFCIIKLPLTVPMAITIPPVMKPGWRAFYPLTFIMSLVWITVFAYCMVWWATMVCTVSGLSQSTMGITFLAAGTSVPDLITSVIVARAGHGDMAVSSSIGSNLFDVTVGLPLPWLLFSLFNLAPSVPVSSAGIACQIGMLFIMLIAVILSIIGFKWRMTKPMGFVMMALYAGFLGVAVSMSQCILDCPIVF